MEQGDEAHEQHRLQEAMDAYSAAVADPGLGSATGDQRHTLFLRAGLTAAELEQYPLSLELFRRAAMLPQRTGRDLWAIYAVEARLGDRRGAVIALTEVLRFDASAVEDREAVRQTFDRVGELAPGDPAGPALLEAAYAGHFRDGLGEPPGDAWIHLAASLLERGDVARAARVLDELERPSDLVEVRADRRFAALVDERPAYYDVVAAARRRAARLQLNAASAPRSLEALVALAQAEKELDHAPQALRLLDGAMVRLASFDDSERYAAWLHDERARVLWQLGRRNESLAEFQWGVAFPERGASNVSQRINLAQRYVLMNRPQLALDVLDEVDDDLTPHGHMAFHYARVSAADELGDKARREESLEFLRAHEPDAPQILLSALVRIGLFDEAARVYLSQLDDPDFRAAALHDAQSFKPAVKGAAPARWSANWRSFRARADIQGAIAKYGRIQHYDLPPL